MRAQMKARIAILLLLLDGTVTQGQAAAHGWTPSRDQVARLEKKLVLPPDASPLGKYGRYYWGEDGKGGKVIYGTLSLVRKPGLRVGKVPSTDYIMDGGCIFISVVYDPSKDSVSAQCNGLA